FRSPRGRARRTHAPAWGALGRRWHHGGRRHRPAHGPARDRRTRHRLAEGAHAAARARLRRPLRARLEGDRERATAALLLRLPARAEGGRRTLDRVDAGHLARPGAARRAPAAARRGLGQRACAPRPSGARHARGRDGARPSLARARVAEPGGHRRHPRRGPPGARLMAYRVLLTDALGPEGLARLREQPELEIEARPGLSPAELRDAVRDFHALIIRSGTKVTADVLARADALRVIGRAGIGVDNVDVDAATKKGIVVMNTPGGSNVTTAEHAITLLLALARNVPQAAAGVRAGRWERERWLGT